MGGQEPSSEGGGVDIVEAGFDIEKRVETFSLGLWRVLPLCVRVRQASEELSPGRETH